MDRLTGRMKFVVIWTAQFTLTLTMSRWPANITHSQCLKQRYIFISSIFRQFLYQHFKPLIRCVQFLKNSKTRRAKPVHRFINYSSGADFFSKRLDYQSGFQSFQTGPLQWRLHSSIMINMINYIIYYLPCESDITSDKIGAEADNVRWDKAGPNFANMEKYQYKRRRSEHQLVRRKPVATHKRHAGQRNCRKEDNRMGVGSTVHYLDIDHLFTDVWQSIRRRRWIFRINEKCFYLIHSILSL